MAATAETAAVVAAALVWAVSGGLHDTATLTAAAIASRALTPIRAVALVGGFGFLGPLVVGTAVASTIATFVNLSGLTASEGLRVVAAGVVAAMAWNLLTWLLGIPASSTHGLVGGLVGATLLAAGPGAVVWGGAALQEGRLEGVMKIVVALLLSPPLGLLLGFAIFRVLRWALRGAGIAWSRRLRGAQTLTVAGLAFAHGANEAQKCMGVIALALLVGGTTGRFEVPLWAAIASAATIPVAAAFGGWRIVRTLGYGIYRLRPLHAVGAQLAAATVVGSTAVLGGPVSTGQVASSAIMGVGSAERPRSVRWDTGKAMIVTWLLTIPSTILLGAGLAAIVDALASA